MTVNAIGWFRRVVVSQILLLNQISVSWRPQDRVDHRIIPQSAVLVVCVVGLGWVGLVWFGHASDCSSRFPSEYHPAHGSRATS